MWTFQQSTGKFFDPTGTVIDTGYSGMGLDKDNPADETIKNMGPLPEGKYHIGPAIDHTKLGPIALPLYPDVDNCMFGRSGFYIHADSLNHPGKASEGCIVISTNTRLLIKNSNDRLLQVVT